MEIEDDGRTIASMDFDAIGGRRKGIKFPRKSRSTFQGIILTKKERFAMVKAAMLAVFPIVFAFSGLFLLAFILMDVFWLN